MVMTTKQLRKKALGVEENVSKPNPLETPRQTNTQASPAPFSPTPNFRSQVFPDGRKIVTAGGRTFNLTPEEAKYFDKQEGKGTPNALAALEAANQNRRTQAVEEELKTGADITTITKALLEKEAERRNLAVPVEIPDITTIQEQVAAGQEQANTGALGVAGRALFGNNLNTNTLTGQANVVGGEPVQSSLLISPIGNGAAGRTLALTGGKLVGGTGAALAGAGIFSLTSKKSLTQQDAEQGLTDAISLISQDIELVRQGRKNPAEVRMAFERAASNLNRLQASTKGLGKLNVRYFVLHGKDVEEAILNAKDQLENMREELNLAAQEGRLAVARASFGQ